MFKEVAVMHMIINTMSVMDIVLAVLGGFLAITGLISALTGKTFSVKELQSLRKEYSEKSISVWMRWQGLFSVFFGSIIALNAMDLLKQNASFVIVVAMIGFVLFYTIGREQLLEKI